MIDVSEYQGRIDWAKVYGAGIRHAYIKYGEFYQGSYHVDSQAGRNITEARRHGVNIGLYFFGHPSQSPQKEARWFLRSSAPFVQAGDLPPALDLEQPEGHDWSFLNDWKATWFQAADAEYGVRACFYSYYAFWKQMTLYKDRPVWGAATAAGFKPPVEWSIHQYSFTGKIDGIDTKVDLDRILKDIPMIGGTT